MLTPLATLNFCFFHVLEMKKKLDLLSFCEKDNVKYMKKQGCQLVH